jgi:hypothetical protein
VPTDWQLWVRDAKVASADGKGGQSTVSSR